MTLSHHSTEPATAFTLMEVLFAVAASSLVLLAIHMVFYGSLSLRNKTAQSIEAAVPLQQVLKIIKGDLANLVAPSGTGTFSGTLQTPLLSGESAMGGQSATGQSGGGGSSASQTASGMAGQQVGPTLYTATGVIDETSPWAEIQKVAYYLVDPTNNTPGKELYRSVTRNLLPVVEDESDDQWLMSGVEDLVFQFYDGMDWQDSWDSTTSETNLPLAIKVQLELAQPATALERPPAIELVVPVVVQTRTNEVAQATGGGF